MSAREIVIVRTGSANLASVCAALERVGMMPRITEDAALVASAGLVVLPGVGAFGPAMAHLRERGLDTAIRCRVENQRPLLAICLGMQLLCESSEESPGASGLGMVPGRVVKLPASVGVPQMGWNSIHPSGTAPLLQESFMYFANSFVLSQLPAGWDGATTTHGMAFASALERGALLACQFHPELSGHAGLALLRRWVERSTIGEPRPC